MGKLDELLKDVPEELEEELVKLIKKFLDERSNKEKVNDFTFSWEGALSHLKDEYTIEELEELGIEGRK